MVARTAQHLNKKKIKRFSQNADRLEVRQYGFLELDGEHMENE